MAVRLNRAHSAAANSFSLDPGTDAGFRLRPAVDAVAVAGAAGGVSVTGTGNAFALATFIPTGAADVTFSADQTRLYVAMRNGDIKVFDVATGANVATWDIGTKLGGISLSEDGSFLLVTERQVPGSDSILYKVATATGTAETFSRPGQAFYDVEIVDADTAILTGGGVTRFHLATSTFSSLPGSFYSSNNAVLSEDGRHVLVLETAISPGPMHMYDDVQGTVGPRMSHQGVNWGSQAVSEAAGLVVVFLYRGWFSVYDLNLNLLKTVSAGGGQADGITFDHTGQYAYAYLIEEGVIAKYYTGDWTEVERIQVGTSDWHNDVGFGGQLHLDDSDKILTILDADGDRGRLQLLDFRIRDETFTGATVSDILEGGKGDDLYLVSHAGVTIIEKIHEGRDRVETSVSYALGAGQHIEILSAELNGGGAALVLTGNELGQEIHGNAGDNVLNGLGGNDVLLGGGGADVLIGGTGNDAYRVEEAGDVVVEAAGEGVDAIYVAFSMASYALAAGVEIETLSAIDTNAAIAMDLTGNEYANRIYGTAGSNTLIGGGGADALFGGAGNDFYRVEDAGDLVIDAVGGGFDSVYAVTSYALNAGAEVELLSAIDPGSAAAMNLTGNEFANILIGTAGSNTLIGGAGSDTLVGGGGNDFYRVETAGDVVVEGAGGGSDSVYAVASYTLAAGSEVELLSAIDTAAATAMTLTGNEYANRIYGNAGSNTLIGGDGADTLIGGGGNDFYRVEEAGDIVVEGVGGGSDSVYTVASYMLAAGSEIELLSAIDPAATTGMTLVGNEIGNRIYGNAGADTLIGGGGNDILFGGAGNDVFRVEDAGDLVAESAGGGSDAVYAVISYALAAGSQVELLSAIDPGSTAAMNLTGNNFAQTIIGTAGVNTLIGGAGNDVLAGGAGNDFYRVEDAGDVILESAAGGSDSVYAAVSYTLGADAAVELLSAIDPGSSAPINLTGNGFASSIYGNAGGNVLDGKGGDDILTGGAGNDIFAFTSGLGGGNVDAIADFTAGADGFRLDDAVFTAIGALGVLSASAFVTGSAAADVDDRIVYDSATGQLFYDADGSGAVAAILFATLQGAPILSASNFEVI